MVQIKKFVFSPFQENTYVLYNEDKEAWIIDPGCFYEEEAQALKEFILEEGLTPVKLLNTHCHLDHIFGNNFVHREYGLLPEYHKLDQPMLDMAPSQAKLYGIDGFQDSPNAESFLKEGTTINLGQVGFEVRFVPGHAPGHVAFINHSEQIVIGGDVLFHHSIGRTDLPFGDYDTLIHSIKSQFYTLAPEFTVYSGHGPETTIGEEINNNPFTK
ncbi:MAG TPA: MBL fold hydrolase [Flavobacteriales bacterium]|nr:MBL fold hydrolase [Flavobacteriales bacterium]